MGAKVSAVGINLGKLFPPMTSPFLSTAPKKHPAVGRWGKAHAGKGSAENSHALS